MSNTMELPERWWIFVPELSDAFQVEMEREDRSRALCWGNQVVGRAVRQPDGRWASRGRDDVALPSPRDEGGLYPSAVAALICARDAWRGRAVSVSEPLGEDYWIEHRAAAGVESLWLGRIHLGYGRPRPDCAYEAFTTNDDPIEAPGAIATHLYPDRDACLLAVRHAWRAHLHRILHLPRPSHHRASPGGDPEWEARGTAAQPQSHGRRFP